MPGKIWTEEEVEKLIEIYPETDNFLLAEIMGKTPNAIRKKASRLNLRKEIVGRTNVAGYVYVMDKENPESIPRGYILEHRKVMSEHIGRPLAKDEIIHHRNGNKSDNRIENLQIMTQSEHSKFHKSGDWKGRER